MRVQFLQSKSKGCPAHHLISLGWSEDGVKGKPRGGRHTELSTERESDLERVPTGVQYSDISGVQKGAKGSDSRENSRQIANKFGPYILLPPTAPQRILFLPFVFWVYTEEQ